LSGPGVAAGGVSAAPRSHFRKVRLREVFM
jgi:hypothetical protein